MNSEAIRPVLGRDMCLSNLAAGGKGDIQTPDTVPEAPVPLKPHRPYYPYFDYLRFALASVVMFSHDDLITWHAAGKYAVDIFFALSGWLIGGILIESKKDDLPRFYFNRAIRIWGPYYIALAILVGASVLKDSITLDWAEFVFYKLTFVYNIFGPPQLIDCYQSMPLDGTGNHFWTVNAEEQFYLLAPFLLVLLPRIGRSLFTWCIVAASAWTFDLYAPISFGVLAAIAVKRYGPFYQKRAGLITVLAITLGSATAVIFGFGECLSPLMSIGVVMLFAVEGKRQVAGAFLGGLSYPLYLNHWVGVFALNMLLDPFGLRDSLLRQILACLFSYFLAALLYWFADRKLLSLRGQLFTERRGRVVTAIAYGSVLIGILAGLAMIAD